MSMLALPIRTYTRLAGVLYLVIAVLAAFSIGYVTSVVVVPGDAAATLQQLSENRMLFGFGVLSDMGIIVAEIVLSAMLFILFRPVSPTLSLIALICRLMMTTLMAGNLLLHVVPLAATALPGGLPGVAAEDLAGMVALSFAAHEFVIAIWSVLFAGHLLPLGYMIFRSRLLPSWMGLGATVGALGYGLQGLTDMLVIDQPIIGTAVVVLLVVASISELLVAFYLLIRGVRQDVWTRLQATDAA